MNSLEWSLFQPHPSPPLHPLQTDLGHGAKPSGYYVRRPCGLFVAPWPQSAPELKRVCELFELLGILLAKCIQDGRRIDLPLASPFFKLMCTPPAPTPDVDWEHGNHDNCGEGYEDRRLSELESNDVTKGDVMEGNNKEEASVPELLSATDSCPWFEGILGPADLAEVDPVRAKFLAQLKLLVEQRDTMERSTQLSQEEKESLIRSLTLPPEKGNESGAKLEDLWYEHFL